MQALAGLRAGKESGGHRRVKTDEGWSSGCAIVRDLLQCACVSAEVTSFVV